LRRFALVFLSKLDKAGLRSLVGNSLCKKSPVLSPLAENGDL
jgi:hypothetical protein